MSHGNTHVHISKEKSTLALLLPMRFLFFIIIITLTLFGKGDIYADRYEERGDADFFFSQMHRNFAPI